MAFELGAGPTLFDKSPYRAHGTISGADWAAGLHGNCLDFVPTVPGYVEIPASYDQLDFTTEDFSMVVRVKVDDLAAYRYIYCRAATKVGYGLRFESSGALGVLFRSASLQWAVGSPGSTGTWYTLGFTRQGVIARTYKDGVDDTVATSGNITGPASCSQSAKIGIFSDAVLYPFDGKIEFLAVFGVALSALGHLAWHNALS